MKIIAPNYTQTPNELFDHWLPLLKQVELKVLLVIMRKTFGWHKIRDKISLTQLQQMTGSNATNVIRAVESLIKKGLVRKQIQGPIGSQVTYYELIIEEVSNNSYPCQIESGTTAKLRGGTTAKLAVTKETNTKEKQQQAAAVSQQTLTFFECLDKLEIPISDKVYISNTYSEEQVKNAIKWATHSTTKITKSLGAAIKWACKNNPLIPKDENEEVKENFDYVKKYDGAKNEVAQVYVCKSHVEIVFLGCQKNPFVLNYREKKFKEIFDKWILKLNILGKNEKKKPLSS